MTKHTYFYWHRRNGKIWPQASIEHPQSRLQKDAFLVGPVHELAEEDRHLTLHELMQKFPAPEDSK